MADRKERDDEESQRRGSRGSRPALQQKYPHRIASVRQQRPSSDRGDSPTARKSVRLGLSAMDEQIAYLQSLPSVRERCTKVYALAEQDKLDFWELDASKTADIVEFCCSLIKVRDLS